MAKRQFDRSDFERDWDDEREYKKSSKKKVRVREQKHWKYNPNDYREGGDDFYEEDNYNERGNRW